MTEAYSVSAKLNISTNAEQVIRQLIEQFEDLDKAIRGTQEKFGQFDEEIGETGKGGTSALAKAFADLKMPKGLLADLNSIAAAGKEFATSSAEAAAAWKDIAAASKSIKGAAITISSPSQLWSIPRQRINKAHAAQAQLFTRCVNLVGHVPAICARTAGGEWPGHARP